MTISHPFALGISAAALSLKPAVRSRGLRPDKMGKDDA